MLAPSVQLLISLLFRFRSHNCPLTLHTWQRKEREPSCLQTLLFSILMPQRRLVLVGMKREMARGFMAFMVVSWRPSIFVCPKMCAVISLFMSCHGQSTHEM